MASLVIYTSGDHNRPSFRKLNGICISVRSILYASSASSSPKFRFSRAEDDLGNLRIGQDDKVLPAFVRGQKGIYCMGASSVVMFDSTWCLPCSKCIPVRL